MLQLSTTQIKYYNQTPGNTYPEVGGTRRQDHSVSSDKLPVSREGDVHQTLLLQEAVHDGEDGGGVIVPFQTKLLPHSVTTSTARTHPSVSEFLLPENIDKSVYFHFICELHTLSQI